MFRPIENNWYVLRSSDNSAFARRFGVAGNAKVPGDYDGDGKADIAVKGGNSYSFVQSSNGQERFQFWGLFNDIPTLGDYDGDARTDFAIFRPSDGFWHVLQSTGGYRPLQFGQNGDVPLQTGYLP